ncbi:putative signal transduction protein with CBS domain containing protein [Alkalidesulfovibrio alkalitolerans DSM 16529]|uniref:Putative signal transduction protein with CBS domain containing protein n=1 Tax=Alkalidesulfovibrio alkalitolerans DSM 16529 TaxID=1121439 RepID=S7UP59_9BACT|nr:glycine betaine/L-proline ABC transporter ATP-binding protein [Alkalidesulfovibrio alkalitolerans]EPR35759.1 putative signal transduction protein with CBS domain containing protein [Alkalidesulfovibrio alkalitolerans DSM 16529]
MSSIVVENLFKIFGSNPERAFPLLEQGVDKQEILEKTGLGVGVNNASFEVKKGEIVVVMGLSGSGKSTLVRCLNRLIEPTRGRVLIDGRDVTALSPDELRNLRLEKLGMVFQNFALFPHRTVAENAAYGLEVKGEDPASRREKAIEALAKVGLAGWEDSYPSQLSGGMQQRVGLARALALDPEILLMDEAFSALDPLIRRDMQDELLSLQEEMRKTIVFISHDLDEALKLGDRIVLMKDGAIVQIGTPEDILTNPADDYVSRFVAEVDITKVLVAESVMRKPAAVAYLEHDGPRAALRKMKKESISSLFVLDADHRLTGIVSAEDCVRQIEAGERDLSAIMRTDLTTASPDTPAQELIQIMHDLPYPLAVTNQKGRIVGVIVRGALLGAIAERGRNADDS